MNQALDERQRVAAAAAEAARTVPGVAYLSPGLAHRLRSAAPPHAGVRAYARGGDGATGRSANGPGDASGAAGNTRAGGWTVEVSLAVLSGHQAAAVARSVRAAVRDALKEAVGTRTCR
ncbi:Asp23/Gls24 family envelope stress response protein [Streptomyces sp. M19]